MRCTRQLNGGEGELGTDEANFLVDNDEVQEGNGVSSEKEAVATDRVEQGESFGAVERQENVREPEVNFGGEKRRQRMVPKMPLDHRGIDPRAFRPQHQRYVGAYPIHVDPPVPDDSGTTRQANKVKWTR
jgi:hypothetical protein